MTEKQLLSGNEAVALGAHDAGCSIGCGYPGTPSTETLEAFSKLNDTYAEWCTNEKVALEVAIGASCGGARVLTTMKHVGVNVAADPLFTAAYTGVGGGLVLLAADDPGMHSSQNEQDTRYYGLAAKIPVFEPSDSQEAYEMAKYAFNFSEEYDVPVIIRSTVRVSHTKTPVQPGQVQVFENIAYEKNSQKWVMMPAFAKKRRLAQLERIKNLENFANTTDMNRIEMRDSSIGIVCSGAVYEHVREAMPDASVLKLGMTWPLPKEKLMTFENDVDKLYVIEEAGTYLVDEVRACEINVCDTPYELSQAGELDTNLIRKAFYGDENNAHLQSDISPENIPARPPSLCAGCPHRIVFRELARQKAIVTGDIGCYTLGALAPLSSIDTCVDMGASISMAHGLELALKNTEHAPIVGVIGDSTFAHSGLESLASTAYNGAGGTICVLDNRTTAMTGRQGNPFNGDVLGTRKQSRELDIAEVAKSLGADEVKTINPNDMHATRDAIKDAISKPDELTVLVFKSPCVLLDRKRDEPYFITTCTGCGVCLTLGCPAIGKEEDTGLSYIDTNACIGCGQCAQYCRFGAIVR